MKIRYVFTLLVLIAVGGVVYYIGRVPYKAAITIHELLSENKDLKAAISNLKAEDQIGYAKVVEQYRENGALYSRMKFIETARDNKLNKLIEKEYLVKGDTVHFDALIVKFGDKAVEDGKSKALYLWRRVYGEEQAPSAGFQIALQGSEPVRYKDFLSALPIDQRQMFWSAIWELANDPEKLRQYDIKAVYGNVVYMKMRPGLIYVFKVGSTGQLYPEVVPEI